MLHAAVFDYLSFDPFPFYENGFIAAEVDISGCYVVQALVVSLVVVIVDECPDLALEITWQVVVFQQNSVLQVLVPAFDFT